MARPKKKCTAAKVKAMKRWLSDAKNNAMSSDVKNEVSGVKQQNLEHSSLPQKIEDTIESPNYIIMDVNILSNLFSNLICSKCKTNSLCFVLGESYGFSHKIKIVCNGCSEVEKETFTSKRLIQSDGTLMQSFDVNMRVVQAFLSFGRGYSALEIFCMYTNMHLMSSRVFNRYKKMLHKSVTVSSEKSMAKIRNDVREEYGVSGDAVADIAVSFDGTWLTRGHTSQIGVGCVIDILTGYALDYEVMSKYCAECAYAKADLGEKSAEYDVWYESHKPSCSINHTGSSGAMEMEAAYKIWCRSEKLGFRYTTILSDGDSKTFNYLNDKKVYGSDILIKKEECVNHVSKRLGTALRKAVQDWRAKGVTLGGKSYGSLKEETIKKLTRYYQNAILRNKGDINGMKSAIYATLLHNTSTDAKPQHHKCPSGVNSWCFYQASLANDETPGLHKDHLKTPVNSQHLEKIMPIYQRLASNELLQRCMRCLTQNSNESLHSMIWSKCSKDASASLQRVTIAVAGAVSEFNLGTLKSLENIYAQNNILLNKESKHIAMWRDYRRAYQRKRKKSTVYLVAQKKIKLARQRREHYNLKKSCAYKSGCF